MLYRHTAFLLLLLLLTTLTAEAIPLGNDSIQVQATPAIIGEIACFAARDARGVNLWCTEGTAETTRPVTSLGPDDQIPHQPTAVGGQVYFAVASGSLLTLWRSDGTIGGTSAVAPLGQVRLASAQPHRGELFFTTYEDGAGADAPHRLWRSDGTAAGTRAFTEVPSTTRLALSAGDFLYLVVGNGQAGTLWRTDASAAGTLPLEVAAGSFFATAGTTFLFESADQLWRSDGTPAGTYAIAADRPVSSAILDGATYVLLTRTFVQNQRLIRTDGTFPGSVALALTPPSAYGLVASGDRLFFVERTYGEQAIWTSLGTQQTTHAVAWVSTFHEINAPVAAGNLVYFTIDNVLWRTDGTQKGTYAILEQRSRFTLGRPVRFGERALVIADDGVHGSEPWISGGTAETTSMIANIHDEAVLRGRVTDAMTGAGIPKARVFLHDAYLGQQGFRADDEGQFVIEGVRDGIYRLQAHGDSPYVPQFWRGKNVLGWENADPIVAVAGSRLDFEFALERSVVLSGRIVGTDGKPVPHASVVVASHVGGPEYSHDVARADGTYVTAGAIPAGAPFVVYTSIHGYSSVVYDGIECMGGCGRHTRGKEIVAASGEIVEGIDFVVKRWGRVRGRLLDALTGEPVPTRVSVRAQGTSLWVGAMSSRQGTYDLSLPDDRYRLSVEASPHYAAVTITEEIVPVPGGMTYRDIRLMPLGGRITGRVTDATSGTAVAGMPVHVRDAAGVFRAMARTGPDGTYVTLPILPPGTYFVETGKSSTPVHPADRRTVTIASIEIARADFVLGRFASIRGVVRDAVTRQPLDDATVTLTTADGLSAGSRLETDAQGRFAFESLQPGDYLVTAVKTGWEKSAPSPIRIGFLGAIAEVDLDLGTACATAPTTNLVKFTAAGGSVRVGLGATCARCVFRTEAFVEVSRACSASDAVVVAAGKNRGGARRGLVVLPGGTIVVEQDGTR